MVAGLDRRVIDGFCIWGAFAVNGSRGKEEIVLLAVSLNVVFAFNVSVMVGDFVGDWLEVVSFILVSVMADFAGDWRGVVFDFSASAMVVDLADDWLEAIVVNFATD